jgi:hypothetical protein
VKVSTLIEAVAVIVVLLAVNGTLRAQGAGDCPSFPNPKYEVASSPNWVMSADLDGDGDRDLAVANYGSGTVSVLLNQGNGTFAPQVTYGVGSSPSSVTSADLDGDGDQDLAVANYGSDTVSVLLNQGNGTFATEIQYGVGSGPSSVTSADLDGDGDQDLAAPNSVSDSLSDAVSVLLNSCHCSVDASWLNYGSGWPGTNGIPSFTAANDPELCTTISLNLLNSLGANTMAVFVGLTPTDQPTIYDGHLLVMPTNILALQLPGGGVTLSAPVPCNPALCGLSAFLQALEVDGGASKGISFTPGLQLELGS